MYLDITISFDAAPNLAISGVDIYKFPSQRGIPYRYTTIPAWSGANAVTSFTDRYGMIGDSYAVQFITSSGYEYSSLQNYQHGTTNSMDLMIEEVRRLIGDEKFNFSTVIRENAGTTSGSQIAETFYTAYTPVMPGSESLAVGRWFYTPVLASGDIWNLNIAGRTPSRQYIYNIDDAAFILASGVPRTAGDTVYATYTWLEPKAPRFSDMEIKLFIADGVPEINNRISAGLNVTGYGPTKTFSGSSNPIILRMMVLNGAKYATRSLQETLTADGIYIRDGDVTIDTTKTLKDRAGSIKAIDDMLENMYQMYEMRGQMDYVSRLDTFSTTTADLQGLVGLGQYIEVTSADSGGSSIPGGYD